MRNFTVDNENYKTGEVHMTFLEWMKKQIKRDDPVGDLARDISYYKEIPWGNDFNQWWRYLLDYQNVSKRCMRSFNRAWYEYHEELLQYGD